MARKVERKKFVPEPGANDLEILHPEREVTIAGRTLVVREYGFIEGLRLMPLAEPLIQELQRSIESRELEGVEAIHALLARHVEVVVQLMAVAADVEQEWIEGLGQDAGTALMFWWWTVNGPFYVRCAGDRAKAALVQRAQRAGQTSTPPSSPPDSETPPPSAE